MEARREDSKRIGLVLDALTGHPGPGRFVDRTWGHGEGDPVIRSAVRMAAVAATADLSAVEARRIALSAQGLAEPWPTGRVGLAHIRRVASRLGAVQVDSVNVLIRSHFIPFFSRLGPSPTHLLDRLAFEHRGLFAYLGHAASLLPIELHPLIRWRMARFAETRWDRLRARIERDRPG
jgi:uncharacterized protein YcaQ